MVREFCARLYVVRQMRAWGLFLRLHARDVLSKATKFKVVNCVVLYLMV